MNSVSNNFLYCSEDLDEESLSSELDTKPDKTDPKIFAAANASFSNKTDFYHHAKIPPRKKRYTLQNAQNLKERLKQEIFQNFSLNNGISWGMLHTKIPEMQPWQLRSLWKKMVEEDPALKTQVEQLKTQANPDQKKAEDTTQTPQNF